jgi:hypothetical protein
MGEKRDAYMVLVGKPRGGKVPLEDLIVDGREALKWMLK